MIYLKNNLLKAIKVISVAAVIFIAFIYYSYYNKLTEQVAKSSVITEDDNYIIKDNVKIKSGINSRKDITEKSIPAQNNISGIDKKDEKYIFPASGYIIKEFNDVNLEFSREHNDYRTHNGIDITTNGEGIKSIADGYIDDVYLDAYGNYIIKIAHGNGLYSVYKNIVLSKDISPKKEIKQGDFLGKGITDNNNEEYFHFEIISDGKTVDPAKFFK